MQTFKLSRVAGLLGFSGACALIYQVAWFRELRLIFGASTAASAAVLAVFMGGLGLGGMVLGKRADAARNPLAFYAALEGGVALLSAITPGLVYVAELIYLRIGGAAVLGNFGATAVRLLLSAIVLGPPAFLMGGTLPAAARAVERQNDEGRQRVATLYGINTLGAVLGTLAANFVLVEVFGTRITLWLACLINGLMAVVARAFSRAKVSFGPEDKKEGPKEDDPKADAEAPSIETDNLLRWLAPTAAAVAGGAFMLMELVWYRMLAPLLGGSSYTFGLILAIALAGIGLGGLIYSRTKRPATISLFALTAALEALTLAVPFALGDRLAVLALLLRPLAQATFGTAILAWTIVASIVVLPAAIVSGYQFPVIIGLYGRGSKRIGRHVGSAYLANTLGSIVGSLSGGFGLLPLLSSVRCWQLVTLILVVTAAVAAALDVRLRRRIPLPGLASIVTAVPAALLLLSAGPTAAWRHSGIGGGRADLAEVTQQRIDHFLTNARYEIAWEAEGRESSVAVSRVTGFTFLVNGKADGSIIGDAGTQVMAGMLGALLHGNVKKSLVVGLGTGSTAGWLGLVPTVERVDVVELEPAILRVARDCAPANGAVLDNPKVHITIGDAREVLRTTTERYDLVFSEPSNPYRAGISSLYTVEFYRAAAERVHSDGLFLQWIQAYEVDPLTVSTAAVTLHEVFPNVTMWQTMGGDLLLVGSRNRTKVDVDRIRALLRTEPFNTAARSAWKTTSAEGVLARFFADASFVDVLANQKLGLINTDDQNFLEFAFARNVGIHRGVVSELRLLVQRLDLDRPHVMGAFDPTLVDEEKLHANMVNHARPTARSDAAPPVLAYSRALERMDADDYEGFVRAWTALERKPRSHLERMLLANAMARVGDDRVEALLADIGEAERELVRALWLIHKNDRRAEALEALERGFVAMRKDPWVSPSTILVSLKLAVDLGRTNPEIARRLAVVLREPFAVENTRSPRLDAAVRLARASRDAKLCVEVIDGIGVLPFSTSVHEARVACYEQSNDPRLTAARIDLGRIQSYTLPFGADLPSAPRAKSPPPQPSSDSTPEVTMGSSADPHDTSLDGGSIAKTESP